MGQRWVEEGEQGGQDFFRTTEDRLAPHCPGQLMEVWPAGERWQGVWGLGCGRVC